MEPQDKKITQEIRVDGKSQYLLRMDGKELFFFDTERLAKLAVDSMAAKMFENLKKDNLHVFRQDMDEGKKTILSTQTIGRVWNGPINHVHTIDYVEVKHAILIKGRMDLTMSMISDGLPPVPSPSVIAGLAGNYTEEDDSSSDDEE